MSERLWHAVAGLVDVLKSHDDRLRRLEWLNRLQNAMIGFLFGWWVYEMFLR